ncbi:MAG: hypothetical protein NDI90_15995 [Nitrospira sp. BO4]|nr:hypothetical protein [Nitrospira sp. BO4]
MAEWSNWDNRSYTKLDVPARAFGVETKSGTGEQVAAMRERGEGDAIADYCLQNVYVTYACYCRMTFQQPRGAQEILCNKVRMNLNLEETCTR